MSGLIVYGTYLLGLIMVLVYAVKEFNAPEYPYGNESDEQSNNSFYAKLAKPTLPKYMAYASIYNFYMIIFAIFSAAVYILFTKLLFIVPGIEILVGKHEQAEALVAITSALLIIGIVKADDIKVEKVLFFAKWPKIILFGLIKEWLHRFAFIPGLSCDLFYRLSYEDIDLKSVVVKNNLDELFNKKYRDDFEISEYLERVNYERIGNHREMTTRWARLSYFVFVVEKWSDKPTFKNQVFERSLGWLSLKEAYISLIEKMVKFKDKNEPMGQDEEEELSDQIDHLLAGCYRLISCVVFMTAKASEDPLSYIQNIGLTVQPGSQLFSRRGEIFRVVFTLIPTIAIMSFIYTLIDQTSPTSELITNIITYVVSAFIIMVLPLILVLALKRHMAKNKSWRVVSIEEPYLSLFDMPLGIYTMISLVSWAISLVFMMLIISSKGLTSELIIWKSMTIFCFISAVTAFVTCYRIDIPPNIYKNRFSFLLGISKIPIIHALLTALIVWVGLNMVPTPIDNPLIFWQYPLLGFLVSLIIGYTLFYGKHVVEKRKSNDRIDFNLPVMVLQDENKMSATMINKGTNGAMLMLGCTNTLIQSCKVIEIIFNDGLRKTGTIVNMNMNQINIKYIN